ncbi:PGF-pre-PGF domain-containing protein [Candidatus Woesearchaeota archaeon]|nr:PGF-pre-PGF domain-containing protein [Candidatus Woesearchaeota archaeon]
MRKEGYRGVFSSRDARVNIVLFASILVIFALTMIFVEAMTVQIRTPANSSFNTTTNRNINFTFNATWFLGGLDPRPEENESHCSLWINSTTNQIAWSEAKFVNITLNNTAKQPDDAIFNSSSERLSYMNYTFTRDGNYTFAIGCFNSSNSSAFAGNYNRTDNLTFSGNFSVFVDASAPTFNFTTPTPSVFNTSTVSDVSAQRIEFTLNDSGIGLNMSLNLSINLTIYLAGEIVANFTYTNKSSDTNLTCNATAVAVTNAVVGCNATFTFTKNGTYLVNASAVDALGLFSTKVTKVTIDQIPPIVTSLNFTNGTITGLPLGGNTPTTVPADGSGTWAQGRKLFGIANVTDNLTRPIHAYLQFYNVTSSSWTTVNRTSNEGELNISPSATDTNGTINLTYVVPTGHNLFEGANVSFRYLVNDTLGNINTSGNVINITIQINDTTKPTLLIQDVAGISATNNSNISDTTPTITWNTTEGRLLRYVAIQIDGSTSAVCNKFANYTQSDGLAESNKNGSITVSSSGTCPLANGTRVIRLTAEDTWGNSELYIHSFTVDTGEGGPNITLVALQNGLAAINKSNVTPYTGINFTVVNLGTATIKNLSFTSSCNSTVQTFGGDTTYNATQQNGTFIYPFNHSQGTCKGGVSGNRTVTIQAYDFSGNSQTKMFQFLVDDLGPSVAVNTPTPGFSGSGNITFNISALDDSQRVSQIMYFLDPAITLHPLTGVVNLNVTTTSEAAVNTTNTFRLNFTPGTHTIKFRVNDSLGKATNSSVVKFTVIGNIPFGRIRNITQAFINQSYVAAAEGGSIPVNLTMRVKTDGVYQVIDNENATNQTYEFVYQTNGSVNVTITELNGSAANWDKLNFTPYINDTATGAHIVNNWTNTLLIAVVFNNSLQDFIGDNNSYYGIVTFPFNNSNRTPYGPEFWWITDVGALTSRTNISACDGGFTRASTTPCWNYSSGGRTIVQVPHFSVVVAVNDSSAPKVNVTTPGGNTSNERIQNQTVSSFVPNITVSADAATCYYHLNATAPTNKTMTLSGNICLGSTENVKNLNAGTGYNITFWVIDNNGNTIGHVWEFNMSDTTPPNTPNSTTISTSVGETTSTVTISGINETVNATVFYATTVSGISASTSAVQTDFNQSQDVSLTGLSASTLYHFNVTICDFNGNCARNGTFNFTTSAASAAAAAASTSSSSGGGGGGAAPVSNVAASTGTQWDSLAAGASGTVTVKNEKIAVTSIVIEVKNAVTSPSVNVQSYTSNPLTSNAAAKVYQYLQLTKSNLADSDASKITISFKVPKSWLSTNGVGESDVVLYRYADSKWNGLPTSKTGDDGTNVLYDSTTPGFSTFAIGNKEAAPAEAPAAETPTEASATEAPVTEVPTAEAPTAPAMEEKKGLSSTALAWIVVLVIVVAAGIGYFMWQKKREQ